MTVTVKLARSSDSRLPGCLRCRPSLASVSQSESQSLSQSLRSSSQILQVQFANLPHSDIPTYGDILRHKEAATFVKAVWEVTKEQFNTYPSKDPVHLRQR